MGNSVQSPTMESSNKRAQDQGGRISNSRSTVKCNLLCAYLGSKRDYFHKEDDFLGVLT